MKKPLFLLLLFNLLFLSCIKKEGVDAKKNASGKINNISILIDEQLWNGEVGDSIRNKFAAPVIGLPQEEPLFTINQYPAKLLEGFMNNTRNIIVVKKENINKFKLVENEFVIPQNVFHISGKNVHTILELIEINTPFIIQKMRETEIKENQRIIDTAKINTSKIVNQFKINLDVPLGYNFVLERKKFIWLKKEIPSGNASILIYQMPINSLNNRMNIINNIIRVRDSIGDLYIHGTQPRTPMITENSYAPYLYQTEIDNNLAFETKGTWELENDFMSGPFINYCIMDKKHKRILVLEGFCYAPSKEKRDLMFELEAIIKSVSILNK